MKRLKISAFFICLFIMALVVSANSQTVRKDANGNYVQVVKKDSATSSATPTGSNYIDKKGNVFPIMKSKNGKLFIVRVSSKTGLPYNSYLKLEN